MEERTIKFRAYNKETKKMYYVTTNQFGFQFKGNNQWGFCDFGAETVYVNQDNGVLIQYTGLKDKNDKEIYEKDILKIFDKNYEVKIVQTDIRSYVYYGYPDEHNGPAPYWVEIIGNVLENPELLK